MNRPAVVVGEALIDIVRKADSPSDSTEYPGGSPTNVAIGLGRLGRTVHLLTRIGSDPRGDRIGQHLGESDVALVDGSTVADETSTADAAIDVDGAAHYTFSLTWSLPEQLDLPDALVVHTGSIAVTLDPGGAAVVDLVRRSRENATITYDPNPRPALIDDDDVARQRIRETVALADVVKTSDEDMRWLDPERSDVEIARDWLSLGPALVIVTRGGAGAVAVTARDTVEIAAPPVIVADTVGAGDAFMAGLLDGLWDGGLLGADRRGALQAIDADDVLTLLRYAATTAALTVERPGADPPRRGDRDRALEAFFGPHRQTASATDVG